MAVTIPRTFGNIIDICENRAKQQGTVQTSVRDFFTSAINESYMTIATERNWTWRKFERSEVIEPAISTGTCTVTLDSREVVFVGLTVTENLQDRTFKSATRPELYRIIGVDIGANSIILDTRYVGPTAAGASYKIYRYEFPVPPDCDGVNQIYIDNYNYYDFSNGGQLDYSSVVEFNRILSTSTEWIGDPSLWTVDGQISYESIPPLDVEVLDYDFLGGNTTDVGEKLRIYPIEPLQRTIFHIDYSLKVEPLTETDQVPLMPIDNRWILVHDALYEWYQRNGQQQSADREQRKARDLLKEMRAEQKKSESKPRMVVNGYRYRRLRDCDRRKQLHWISRIHETG